MEQCGSGSSSTGSTVHRPRRVYVEPGLTATFVRALNAAREDAPEGTTEIRPGDPLFLSSSTSEGVQMASWTTHFGAWRGAASAASASTFHGGAANVVTVSFILSSLTTCDYPSLVAFMHLPVCLPYLSIPTDHTTQVHMRSGRRRSMHWNSPHPVG